MDKISIVVPSYNHGKYLEACLDSIMFQDYGNIEIIIVDDFSTDNSREIIANYIKRINTDKQSYASFYNENNDTIERCFHFRYPQNRRNIKVILNDKNIGSTRTYNKGFLATTGVYCSFVSSDDICHPQLFSTLAEPLATNKADFAYADMFVIDDDHRILREFKLPDYDFKDCFCNWYLCGVATLYRRSLHEQFGFYDERTAADDHECYLRFAMNNARFTHIAKTLYSIRTHDNRKVGLHKPEQFNRLLEESKRLVLKARAWSKTA